MTPTQTTGRWVAVCVSRVSTDHAADVLRRAGLHGPPPGEPLRELGGYAEQFAVETEFQLEGAAPASLRRRLAEEAGPETDVALLPAENRQKRLLICDMDSTIIGQECLDELADFAGFKAEVSAITERAMRGELNFEDALTTRVAMLDGLALSALEQCFQDRIRLSAGAATLVATMKTRGARTLLVSGGFTFFTERVAAAAGFESHHGNTLLDDGTALTGEVLRPILGREAKLETLNTAAHDAGLALTDALAMGDGANDLAMIGAAGLGVAYRAKPIVAAEADAAIQVCDLTATLFYQGIPAADFVST